ncbi:TPA: hypothetical protein ACISS5_000836 [Streptococcus pyogenes]|uniref:hypothetical protein n=1 Tax=Streptococcus pyogenes TaxID=1314 RepID=UPI00109B9A58|nr:hypothetical protein [Streptococcus pyogenes]QCK61519.1 hypothetical protein ETT52_08310 [Streptococcus pyogenes]VGQ64123.1 peptidase [Streptococcus pyogenes]VGQ66668.1 peptidase [Streptococcus pyogenes]VGT48779.1 peptidase [Streptococcus pyogenes]VGU74181.1 Uncharacterised protein [Streptococcus pyogenes]
MEYKNHKIVGTIGEFPLEAIDCFERSLGICLDYYYPGLSSIFFINKLYSKMFESINYSKKLLENSISIIEKISPIRINKLQVKDNNRNINEIITNLIKANQAVIVPINLREIYYSSYFESADWSHPIVINGFDMQKRVYYILDSTQIFGESSVEKEFIMTFEQLENSMNSYFKRINKIEKPFILTFEQSSKDSKAYNSKSKERNILDVLERFGFDEQIEYLNKSMDVKEILNFPKIKKIFLNLIISKVVSISDSYTKNKLMKQVLEICDEWEILTFKLAKNLLAKKANYKIEISSNVREKEFFLKSKLLSLANISQANENTFVNTENDNGIISFVDNIIYFNFTGDKIYNSWFSDNSPKVLLPKMTRSEEIELSVSSNIIGPRFVAGFFFRFRNNDLYYFGLDSGRRVIIDICGKDSQFAFENIFTNKIFQKVIFNEESITCYYKNIEQEEYKLLARIPLDSNLDFEYGIGCKTYESPCPLSVQIKLI